MDKPVYVTKSVLPPLEEYVSLIRESFASHQLTNQSPHVARLESGLQEFLGMPAVLATANGTLALQLALRHLGLAGKKVITTPFTYVATVSALLWEGCEPVFADIDPDTLCVSPAEIEKRLECHPDAAGILPVHVFGNAADVDAIAEIARQRDLRILYDAAHAFGCRLHGKSLFGYGDTATGSFHSTKLFHTVEGGCVALPNAAGREDISLLRAFGHTWESHKQLGINAKMSELHAAMGLCLLPRVPDLINKRSAKTALYDDLLAIGRNDKLRGIKLAPGLEWNHAYYPVIFESEAALEKALAALAKKNIHPRRYFYPSLTRLPYLSTPPCPVADDIASRILCLPLWADMDDAIIAETARAINSAI